MKRLLLMLIVIAALGLPTAAHADGWWASAGVVNLGEAQVRVVYDTAYPGARNSAISMVRQLQREYWYYGQPGSTTGLTEAVYSDHINGMQIQIYTNDPYIGMVTHDLFESYGVNMTGCWDTNQCPNWMGW